MSDKGLWYLAGAGLVGILVVAGKEQAKQSVKRSNDPKPCVVEGQVVSRETSKAIQHPLNVLVYDSSSKRQVNIGTRNGRYKIDFRRCAAIDGMPILVSLGDGKCRVDTGEMIEADNSARTAVNLVIPASMKVLDNDGEGPCPSE